MKVFISWSGMTSKAVARCLHDWIPLVINAVEPFMSDDSIEPGQRWQGEISGQLEDTSFGLVCVTRDNQEARWLNFEAGALAKRIDDSRLVPVAYDLELAEIQLPLGQFNGVKLNQDGVFKLMRSIHSASGAALKPDAFERSLAKWWPDLDGALRNVPQVVPAKSTDAEPRSERDLLIEILESVRGISRDTMPKGGLPDTLSLLEILEQYNKDHPKDTFRARKSLRTAQQLPMPPLP